MPKYSINKSFSSVGTSYRTSYSLFCHRSY